MSSEQPERLADLVATGPDKQAALFAAFARAQARFEPIAKNKTVRISAGREYSYPTLDKILEVLRPALAAEGLAVTQTFRGDHLVTSLLHADGGMIESVMPCPRGEMPPQAYGSDITYCRRYSLTALLGVAGDEDDDDGKTAQDSADAKPKAEPAPGPAVISKAQRDRLFAVARENAVSDEQLAEIVRGVTGEASTKTIPKAEYDRIVAEVQAMQVPF